MFDYGFYGCFRFGGGELNQIFLCGSRLRTLLGINAVCLFLGNG